MAHGWKIRTNEMTREQQVEYLTEHFRYWTANSWNKSTSYARNIKLYKLPIPPELRDRAYEMLEFQEAFYEIRELIRDFEKEHRGYGAGTNGRSSGYMVLYRVDSMRGIDENEDFYEWDDDSIRDRAQLVEDFDDLVDTCIQVFIGFVRDHEIVEEEVTYTKKERVVVPIEL